MIVLDASGLFAALSAREGAHEACNRFLDEPGPFILSPFVLAEVDYFVMRSGPTPEIELLEDVADSRYLLPAVDAKFVGECADVIRRYRDLRIGLADASVVVLAGRYETDRVLTLDERHFRALRTPSGKPFTILPADA